MLEITTILEPVLRMHSLLQSQVRSGPRNVLKVSRKRISRSSPPHQSFHCARRLHLNDPARDGAAPSITGERKPGFKDSEYGKEISKRPTRENAATPGPRPRKAAG